MSSQPVEDYYALLGVGVGAGEEELRVAWRALAARWHPDRAGDGATGMFQRLSAAYTVLSDPVARAAYDRRRRGGAPVPAGSSTTAARAPQKPARPAPPAVMLKRVCGAVNLLQARGALELDEPGLVTLVLSEREAAQGGMISLSMWVDLWCPACAAKGLPAAACAKCGGRRTVQELYAAWLGVPPGVISGEELKPSAFLDGMVEGVRFRVRVSDR
jgi:DnaJ-class molecular chaperone